jgi:hypothetical protein
MTERQHPYQSGKKPNQKIVFEVRANANPETLVTDTLEEIMQIIQDHLRTRPLEATVFLKVRRTWMPVDEFEALPDQKE